MKIVIVHIPKAAGTSLKEAISAKVGIDNIYFDYNRPLAKGDLSRNLGCLASSIAAKPRRESIIFGHFLVGKYARFNGYYFRRRKKIFYVIFLREPLQRAISHFFFWKRTKVQGHHVWERFTQENWSLERFLLSKEHTNFQAKFLWRFPLKQFDFVGLTEYFQDSVEMLGRVSPLLRGLPIKIKNSNPKNSMGVNYSIDSCLAAEFMRRNELDYNLYNQGVKRFLIQKSKLLKAKE
ncbi:sulfotransferase family 2 domain-containing protein [Nitrosococcus watsonii]|uniref:Sulfotransferase family protein n=1 Tax=Nitrosococcus watsoni (strain C-113) TaxID=105559 RepID=D8K576_NITWC|nr:sulfotransferase family 2 domain-containing protein [Nitrosococcus watsonii]ADJ28053.1 conserved hypothetical protein [Nitrosococcus watsonii C-113]